MIIITAVVIAIFMLLSNYLSQLGFDATADSSVFLLFDFVRGLVATKAYRLIKLQFSLLAINRVQPLFPACHLRLV